VHVFLAGSGVDLIGHGAKAIGFRDKTSLVMLDAIRLRLLAAVAATATAAAAAALATRLAIFDKDGPF